jgi:exopolysaccharide biosynthesis polyprenyl glycosylphosphotransferase
MTVLGTFVRRNFEPVILSVQVLVDLVVLLLACWIGYELGARMGGLGPDPGTNVHQRQLYFELSALISAVCLVTFHAFGLYSPTKSLLNMEEFKGIVKSVFVSFLVLFTLIVYLRGTRQESSGFLYNVLVPLHKWIDLDVNINTFSRLTILITFGLVLFLTTASRFASFKVIQRLHQRGIGNRNVMIYGAGGTGRQLQRKFMLVPTLGLNLVGFVDDDPKKTGTTIERSRVLGCFDDLERLTGEHKISEVFVAMPEASEERVMRVLAELQRLGVTWRVVPRFHHLMASKVRIETLDSVPLVTPAERAPSLFGMVAKRLLDLVLSLTVIVLAAPVFVITAILIKKASPGPIFFAQRRIGRDGKPFQMLKFRTMHATCQAEAESPRRADDPRITPIGRWLRRFSLDELPQFLNVIKGDMSVVGPRPEMEFIVAQYGPLDRERLRAKPGITGLWQISYARQAAIHENLDYDLYYIEHQSFLLDLVIIALTAFAVVKGTGAY